MVSSFISHWFYLRVCLIIKFDHFKYEFKQLINISSFNTSFTQNLSFSLSSFFPHMLLVSLFLVFGITKDFIWRWYKKKNSFQNHQWYKIVHQKTADAEGGMWLKKTLFWKSILYLSGTFRGSKAVRQEYNLLFLDKPLPVT